MNTCFRLLRSCFVVLFLGISQSCNASGTQLAPDIHWHDIEGDHNLYEYIGSPVILHFWASWCLACRQEMPALASFLSKDIGSTKLIALSLDKSFSDARKSMDYLSGMPGKITVGIVGANAPGLFGFRSIPSTVIIDNYGKIIMKFYGRTPWGDLQLNE